MLLTPAQTVIARCRTLAAISDAEGQTLRTFLSPAMRRCYDIVGEWMRQAGLTVQVDNAGNLLGASQKTPRLLIGSHLDTVPNAGAFDGVLGVIMGIALAKNAPCGVEVIGFSEEEGVRFATPFIGSRAFVGTLDQSILQRPDKAGITVAQAIEGFGLKAAPSARTGPRPLGFLEFHIEQGPVLDDTGESVALVTAIAGQSRARITFTGAANHAGTTPMSLRQDALAGAAEWIIAVEQTALSTAGLAATNGKITAGPGSINVIAGEASVTLDLRHADDAIRAASLKTLRQSAETIAHRRKLNLLWTDLTQQASVHLDADMTAKLAAASQKAGFRPRHMVSGAGHDAMILAPHIPSAMLFLRTPGGISHDPLETVLLEDVDAALRIGYKMLEEVTT